MKNILIIFFGLIASLLQVSFLANWSIAGASFNLIVLAMLFLILSEYEDEALWWVAIAGIILDIYSPVRFGFNIIQLVIIWIILRWLSKKYFHSPSFLTVSWMIILSVLFFKFPWVIYFGGWWQLMVEPLVNLAIGLPLYFFIGRFIKPPDKSL